MKAFRGFVKKEFLHILRDWQTLLIIIGMPVVQVLLFGFAVRSDIRNIPVAFVEATPDAASTAIIARFTGNPVFKVVRRVSNIAQLEQSFRDGSVRQAIVFPASFAERLWRGERVPVQIISDGSDPNTGSVMEADALAILQTWESERLAAVATTTPAPHRPYQIDIALRMRFNPTLASVNLFVPGLIAYVLIIVSALMTAITIVREKELGTMEMLLVSPLRPIHVILGKLTPYILLAFVDVVLVLAVAQIVFHVPMRGRAFVLLVESLLYILNALAMGVLISTSVSTQRVAMLAALAGLMLPTLLLSGFIFPISALPAPLQLLSNIVPARWFVIIARGVMLKGAGFADLWRETLILFAITAVLLGAGIRRLAIRLG